MRFLIHRQRWLIFHRIRGHLSLQERDQQVMPAEFGREVLDAAHHPILRPALCLDPSPSRLLARFVGCHSSACVQPALVVTADGRYCLGLPRFDVCFLLHSSEHNNCEWRHAALLVGLEWLLSCWNLIVVIL